MGNLSFLNGFNPEDFQDDFSPLPDGEYKVEVIDTEFKPTKAGTGEYLQVTLKVLEGDYSSRQLFDRFNLKNPNSQAVEIAQRQFASLCKAVNVTPNDTSDLHNISLLVHVTIDGEYNRIKRYKALANEAQTPVTPKQKPKATKKQSKTATPAPESNKRVSSAGNELDDFEDSDLPF